MFPFLISWLALGGACRDSWPGERDPIASQEQPVIYGQDDRRDVHDYSDPVWAARVAGFTVALVHWSQIDDSDPDHVAFIADPLWLMEGVCPDERFADQLTAAFCSGTLIAPDRVLTAGHCVSNANDCANTRLVFDYYMDDAATLHTITSQAVYSCAGIVAREWSESGVDLAVLALDRPVIDRAPAAVRVADTALAAGHPLVVHGSPSGLPIKIDSGGRVRDPRAHALDYFVANLDTFAGSSGSGVFDATTGELAGVLVRGEVDYGYDDAAGCYRVNACADSECMGEHSVYAARVVDALCAVEPDAALCACGDGVCDHAGGEDAEACPADCAASEDMCPDDPGKTEPGVCGCGAADSDADHDGVMDCGDLCPADPDKAEPGVCGCGQAEGGCDVPGPVPGSPGRGCHAASPGSGGELGVMLMLMAALWWRRRDGAGAWPGARSGP